MARLERLKAKHYNGNGAGMPIAMAAQLAGWPTPQATSENALRGHGQNPAKRKAGGHSVGLQDAAELAGWPTPRAGNNAGHGNIDRTNDPGNVRLEDTAQLVGWATPASRDYRTPNHSTYAERGGGTKGEQLQNQAAHALPGASLNGSTASMGSAGLLSSRMSGWLQGIPPAWEDHAPIQKQKK
jgi:hypothetical protein